MKKVLFIATVVQKHINVFHLPFLKWFQQEGYETFVAAANDTDQKNVKIPWCNQYFAIDFQRNPLHPGNILAYMKLKKVIRENDFDIIHCHTPVGGLLGRLAAHKARKDGTRVIYTAHGFHFYKGAPLKNWVLYYPVEKLCSYLTDVLVTINQEDYLLATKKMKAKRVVLIPGVGLDTQKFLNMEIDRKNMRESLGVPEDAILLASVGELNTNKNHQIVIRAMGRLSKLNLHYIIAGQGDQHDALMQLAEAQGIAQNVHLLGYRKDIAQLYKTADICILPSIREGLNVAALEGMAAGLPLIASDNRGVRDYAFHNDNAFLCQHDSVDAFAEAIERLAADADLRQKMGVKNAEIAKKFDFERIIDKMKELYKSVEKNHE